MNPLTAEGKVGPPVFYGYTLVGARVGIATIGNISQLPMKTSADLRCFRQYGYW